LVHIIILFYSYPGSFFFVECFLLLDQNKSSSFSISMRLIVTIFVIHFVLISAHNIPDPHNHQSVFSELESFVHDEAVKGHMPGLQVLAVNNENILWNYTYGYVDPTPGLLVCVFARSGPCPFSG
jgi:hypothetical protein